VLPKAIKEPLTKLRRVIFGIGSVLASAVVW